VRAVLILPDGGTIASGNNETTIGDLIGSTSATVAWTVVFPANQLDTLIVQASGQDSNGNPCSVSQSTTIAVIPEYSLALVLPVLMTTALLSAILKKRKRRRDKRSSDLEKDSRATDAILR
jgi:hypothetical protein